MAKGTVKFYNPDRGFGFIGPTGGGGDVFVHATALERAGMGPLQEGQVAGRVGRWRIGSQYYRRVGGLAEHLPD